MFDDPREWEGMLKERYGVRGTTWIIHAIVFGTVAGALIGIGSLAYLVATKIALPIATVVNRATLPSPASWADVILSVAFTALMFIGALIAASLWFKRWNRRLIKLIDSFLKDAVLKRLEYVETNSIDYTSTVENLEWIKGEVAGLQKRIEALDRHTNIGENKALSAEMMKRIASGGSFTLGNLAGIPAPPAWLQIHSGIYGCEPHFLDVSNVLRDNINNGRLEIPVENKTFGRDPYKNAAKELVVTYSVGDGPRRSVSVVEHGILRLPPATQ